MSTDEFDINQTPADEMTKDLSILKNVTDISQLTQQERQKAEQLVKNVLDSVLSGNDITPDKLRENKDILKDLAGKGLDVAKDAMQKIENKKNEGNVVADKINTSSAQTQSIQPGINNENENLTKEKLVDNDKNNTFPINKLPQSQSTLLATLRSLEAQNKLEGQRQFSQENHPPALDTLAKQKEMGSEMEKFMKRWDNPAYRGKRKEQEDGNDSHQHTI